MRIELRAIGKQFAEPRGRTRQLFSDLDLSLASSGGSVAILGRSGSGKSTLLNILAGLDIGYVGEYVVSGETLPRTEKAMTTFRRGNIGIVTQGYDLLEERTAIQNVMLGLGGTKTAYRLAAQRALDDVGMSDHAHRRVRHLSGGESQRVAIARAIVKMPAIVIADEPTGALDEETEDDVLALFDRLQARGSVLVVATHSARVADRCARRLVLCDGRLNEA